MKLTLTILISTIVGYYSFGQKVLSEDNDTVFNHDYYDSILKDWERNNSY